MCAALYHSRAGKETQLICLYLADHHATMPGMKEILESMETLTIMNVLEDGVRKCGELALTLRVETMDAEEKPETLGQHFSTRADRESQDVGISILRETFPNEVIVAEESDYPGEIPKDCIVFDPLDGTTNFFNGGEDFAVTMCMFRGGQPVYGATYFPAKKLLISAARDKGCWINGFKSGERVSGIPWHGAIDKTIFGTDVGPWTTNANTFDTVLRPLAEKFNIVSTISATEGARQVLNGSVGGYYNFGIAKIWDAAAMALAIKEAGGVVSGPDGNPIRWKTVNCDWVVASRQEIADAILEHSRLWSRPQ